MTFFSRSPQEPYTIALIGKYQDNTVNQALVTLAEYLQERGVTIFIERETADNLACETDPNRWLVCGFADIGAHADVAIVIGGDGTMLNAARRLSRYQVPLVGVNQGHLGFMTDIARDEMLETMTDLLEGRFQPEYRMMLEGVLLRDNREIADNLALNDVVIDKGALGRMIEYELTIGGELVSRQRADGLIISTPTGSTAYALSANGPILHPALNTVALVPLCPHALTNRPVLVDAGMEICVSIQSSNGARVYFDGHVILDLEQGDLIRIRRSDNAICFLHPPGYHYFSMLREKLHWS